MNEFICPIMHELARDFGLPIPPHDTEKTIERMCKLADWATRYFVPKLLRYPHPKGNQPEVAEEIAQLKPIVDHRSAFDAVNALHEILPKVSHARDGSYNPPIKQAYWNALAAKTYLEGKCPPAAYGVTGLFDLAEYHGMPIEGEREKLLDLLR